MLKIVVSNIAHSVAMVSKADWETFVTYEGQSIACGDFEWILRGKSVAAGSDQCSAVKTEFFDKVRVSILMFAVCCCSFCSNFYLYTSYLFSVATSLRKHLATCVTLKTIILMFLLRHK